jgi:N-acetylglutamate synthase-like GNAT family acetyltransferase
MNSDHKIAPPVIRLATQADLEGIFQVDPTAKREKLRKEIIRRAVENGACYIDAGEKVKGYAILEYTFFEMGFISLLAIDPDGRRTGLDPD